VISLPGILEEENAGQWKVIFKLDVVLD